MMALTLVKPGLKKARNFVSSYYPPLLRSQGVVIHTFGDGACNSRCVWCLMQYELVKRYSLGKLTFESFKKFLQLNADDKFPLIPYGFGEPTIHKEFVPFCRYALNEGWTIKEIHSNMSFPSLSDDVFDVITQFKRIHINFGGGTKETQYLNMKTEIDVVFENLKRLLQAKAKNKSNLKIYTKMILNSKNITELDILRQKIKQISPDIPFDVLPLVFRMSDGSQAEKNQFFKANLATPSGEVDVRVPCRDNVYLDEKGDVHVTPKLKYCYGLMPAVHFNGDVKVCCRSREHACSVGNAFHEPMKDIMGSKKYKDAEKRAVKRKYSEYCKFCS